MTANVGLVRDSQPFFDARFSCQELNPFLGTEPICLPDDEKSPWSPAAMERFLTDEHCQPRQRSMLDIFTLRG